mmetsp:Transcript_11097/g.15565  ORF Transcript_11097/g.15565 Transcript_11097/m.15565 type:complete len:96 (+) Transcript_11097:74-361(+)
MTHLAGVGVQTVSQSVLDAKAIQEIETTDLHKAIAPLIEFLCGAPVTPGKQGLGKLPSGIRPRWPEFQPLIHPPPAFFRRWCPTSTAAQAQAPSH